MPRLARIGFNRHFLLTTEASCLGISPEILSTFVSTEALHKLVDKSLECVPKRRRCWVCQGCLKNGQRPADFAMRDARCPRSLRPAQTNKRPAHFAGAFLGGAPADLRLNRDDPVRAELGWLRPTKKYAFQLYSNSYPDTLLASSKLPDPVSQWTGPPSSGGFRPAPRRVFFLYRNSVWQPKVEAGTVIAIFLRCRMG